VSAELFCAVQQFVIHEAHLLDHNCFENWADLLDPRVTYSIHEPQGSNPAIPPICHVIKGVRLLLSRLRPSEHGPTSPHDPLAYLIRRCVMNINVTFAHCRGEFAVASYLNIQGIQRSNGAPFTCTAERRDRLHPTAHSFRIISREIFVDSVEPAAFVLPTVI
jgi:3-phenylpropionate/cinnamic acid dioxygenase small subunit